MPDSAGINPSIDSCRCRNASDRQTGVYVPTWSGKNSALQPGYVREFTARGCVHRWQLSGPFPSHSDDKIAAIDVDDRVKEVPVRCTVASS